MPASSASEASQIGRGVGAVGGGSSGIRLGERVADDLHRRLGVARVVPPVRVVARRLGAVALAGHAHGHLAAEVDDLGRAAGVRDHGAHPGVEAVAVEEHELRARDGLHVRGPRLVVVRIGVGLEDLMHARRVTRDRSRPVADLRRRGDDPRTGAPLRRAASAGSEDEREQHSRAGERARRRTRLRMHARAPTERTARHRARRSSAPAVRSARPRATGRRSRGSPTSATDASCQTARRCVQRRTVAAGTTNSAVASSAPIAVSEATTAKATSTSSTASGKPERMPRARAEAGSNPRASQRGPSTSVAGDRRGAGQARQHEIARADQQQAPEEQRVDVAARFEDVARQHDAARQRGDQHERGQAVVARARAAREALHAEREHERRGERSERRREAEPVGQHEPGEGRGADRMGVEREPAHHDPRAEQPRRERQQQHLEHAALHELELKGIEHGEESNRYSFPLQTARERADLAPSVARRLCGGRLSGRGEGRAPSAGRAEPTLSRPCTTVLDPSFPPGHADDGRAGEEAA